MSIAGHVSRAMLSHSHVRMGAKRRALAVRQRAADEKRTVEAERMEQGAGAFLQAAVVK